MISIINAFFKCFIFALMFKKITATILLLAFVSQTFAGPFIMLDYFVNTAAYARNCLNKDKPTMHCNGKCQVMKKIKEEERKEQQNAEENATSKLQVHSSKSFFASIQPTTIVLLKAFAFEAKYPLSDISYSFFHPPQA